MLRLNNNYCSKFKLSELEVKTGQRFIIGICADHTTSSTWLDHSFEPIPVSIGEINQVAKKLGFEYKEWSDQLVDIEYKNKTPSSSKSSANNSDDSDLVMILFIVGVAVIVIVIIVIIIVVVRKRKKNNKTVHLLEENNSEN